MKRLPLRLLILTAMAGLPGLRAAESVAHLDDSGRVLSADPLWTKAVEDRLDRFEALAGFRILVRFHARSPAAEEDKVPGAYMHALASRLGVGRKGALAVYFADEDDWRLWIGDDSTPVFVGRPGTVEALTKSGAIHQVKEAFLAAMHAAAETEVAAVSQAASGQPPDPGLRQRRQAEAMVTGLIGKFGPPPKP